jgi:uncharacterized membrane protein
MREFFIFKNTQNSMYWESTNPYIGNIRSGRTHSMLSITILPTILSNLLNIDSTSTFNILFPIIFSLVPLGLYQLWQKYMDKKYAFISVFLFMAQSTFYTEMLKINRQMIAELFFVLLLLTILNKSIKQTSKIICFMLFSFSLITSHYGLAEIFLVFISLTVIYYVLVKKLSTNITMSNVIFFLVVMFFWYIYTSSSAVFDSTLSFGTYVLSQLGDFFDLASRDPTILRGLGLENPPTFWNAISRAFAYATEFLIVVGFIGLIKKRVKVEYDKDYFTFTSEAMAFLATLVLVPGLPNTMNITRFYHTLLFFLAPLCILGAEVISNLIFNRRRKFALIILLVVLIPYFLFQTNFVYEVTGSESFSLPLSKYRNDAYTLRQKWGYIEEWEVFGAKWTSRNVDIQNTRIYADGASGSLLVPYGMIFTDTTILLTNVTEIGRPGIVYLHRLNVIEEIIVSNYIWNRTEFSILNPLNKIYSNSGSEIYSKIN